MPPKDLILGLAEYALQKPGTLLMNSLTMEMVQKYPQVIAQLCVELPTVSWGTVLNVGESDDGLVLEIPVKQERLAEHIQSFSTVQDAQWAPRDGHIYMSVPTDGSVPAEIIQTWINDAYQIVSDKLDDRGRFLIERIAVPGDQHQLIRELVERHGLSERNSEIATLIRPAILLRSWMVEGDEVIPLGASKLGGLPDLPDAVDWPTFELEGDEKPLAFLGQFDLAEAADCPQAFSGLPKSGLLSLFSVWGWITEEEFDPEFPEGPENAPGWTVMLHTPAGSSLSRREPPDELFLFHPAPIEMIPVLSLPNHAKEPEVAALGWDDDTWETFDRMQADFRSILWGHYLNDVSALATHSLVGGYAMFQQEYPEDLVGTDKRMLIQIGSDGNTTMAWGDGGELTFYVDTSALQQGRFEGIECHYQCG